MSVNQYRSFVYAQSSIVVITPFVHVIRTGSGALNSSVYYKALSAAVKIRRLPFFFEIDAIVSNQRFNA